MENPVRLHQKKDGKRKLDKKLEEETSALGRKKRGVAKPLVATLSSKESTKESEISRTHKGFLAKF